MEDKYWFQVCRVTVKITSDDDCKAFKAVLRSAGPYHENTGMPALFLMFHDFFLKNVPLCFINYFGLI